MTTYLLYKEKLHARHPEYIRKGDEILSISTDRHGAWDRERSTSAHRVIGHRMELHADTHILHVRCTDAGMWESWRIWEKVKNMGTHEPEESPFRLKGYRVWKKWIVEGVVEKERQLTLGGIE